METGCVVSDLGMCSTPAAKLMVTQLGAAAGIILTASHNPAPWNGLKLVRADGLFLNGTQGAQVESLYHSGNVVQRGGGRIEQLPRDEIDGPYLDRILSAVDVELIRSASLRVAADPCNGAGALLLHQLFDRVALVAEDGIPVGEDFTLALAVQAVLASPAPPGPVVTTLSTSQIVSDAATAFRALCHTDRHRSRPRRGSGNRPRAAATGDRRQSAQRAGGGSAPVRDRQTQGE